MTEPSRLRWTPARIAHIARHGGVTPGEAEEVLATARLVETSYLGRSMYVGTTRTGRTLALLVDPHGDGTYTPITARTASRAERRRLAHVTEGLSDEQP